MIEILKDKQVHKSFVEAHAKGSFMQGPEWAELKSDNWKNEVIASKDENGNIKGILSVLIRKVPGVNYTMMYAPRGPVCDICDYDTLCELVEGAKEVAKKNKSYVLKIDPDIEAENEEFAKMCKKLGFKVQKSSKNFEGIQPRFVFRLDIKDKTEDEVMAIFQNKTRYNVRLAQRKGVEAYIGTKDDLKTFHDIMVVTGTRDEFVVRSLEYFEKMYDALSPDNIRLYLAKYDGKIISGTLAIYYGNKVWYLYGASANEYRNVMPNYLLQWEMIKWAIEKKCDIYDFRGVSGDIDESNPLYGLYRFKKGFNGKFTEFMGEIDYVFNPFIYFAVTHGEKWYREIRRRIYLLRGQK